MKRREVGRTRVPLLSWAEEFTQCHLRLQGEVLFWVGIPEEARPPGGGSLPLDVRCQSWASLFVFTLFHKNKSVLIKFPGPA